MRTTLAERIWAGPRPAHGARMLRGLLAAAGACTVVLLAAGTAQAAISYTAYVGNYSSGTLTPVDAATNIAGAALPINDHLRHRDHTRRQHGLGGQLHAGHRDADRPVHTRGRQHDRSRQ